MSRDIAYSSALGGEPCKPGAAGALDEATIEHLISDVRREIVRGGLRLARVLDRALG